MSEQYLLDLEREAFLSLAGMRKTQERLAHMLKTGKPLQELRRQSCCGSTGLQPRGLEKSLTEHESHHGKDTNPPKHS